MTTFSALPSFTGRRDDHLPHALLEVRRERLGPVRNLPEHSSTTSTPSVAPAHAAGLGARRPADRACRRRSARPPSPRIVVRPAAVHRVELEQVRGRRGAALSSLTCTNSRSSPAPAGAQREPAHPAEAVDPDPQRRLMPAPQARGRRDSRRARRSRRTRRERRGRAALDRVGHGPVQLRRVERHPGLAGPVADRYDQRRHAVDGVVAARHGAREVDARGAPRPALPRGAPGRSARCRRWRPPGRCGASTGPAANCDRAELCVQTNSTRRRTAPPRRHREQLASTSRRRTT